MATKTTDDSYFNRNVSGLDAPATAGVSHTALLGTAAQQISAAGEYSARAASLEPKSSLPMLGSLALEAYKGYNMAELEKSVNTIMSNTANPETGWTGQAIHERDVAAGTEMKWQKGVESSDSSYTSHGVGPTAPAVMSDAAKAEIAASKARLQQIQQAQAQNNLTPEAARAAIGVELRKRIAAMPGYAQEFRKMTHDLTGVGQLDASQYEAALKLATKNTSATFNPQKEADEAMFKAIQSDLGYGPDQARVIMSDTAMRAEANARIEIARQQKLVVERAEAASKLKNLDSKEALNIVNQGIATNLNASIRNVVSTFQNTIKEKGLRLEDLLGATGLKADMTQKQKEEALGAMQLSMQNITKFFDNTIDGLNTDTLAQRLSFEDREKLRETLLKQKVDVLKNFEGEAGLSSGLAFVKAAQVAEGESVDLVNKRLHGLSQMMQSAGGSQFWGQFYNPDTREAARKQYPELSKLFDDYNLMLIDGQQKLISTNRALKAVRDGQATSKEIKQEDREAGKNVQEINDARTSEAHKSTAAALQKGVTPQKQSAGAARQVMDAVQNNPLSGKYLETTYETIIGGTLPHMMTADQAAVAYRGARENAYTWLHPSSTHSYTSRIKQEVDMLNARGVEHAEARVVPNGHQLMVKYYDRNTGKEIPKYVEYSGSARPRMSSQSVNLEKLVESANKVLTIHSYGIKYGGSEGAVKNLSTSLSGYIMKGTNVANPPVDNPTTRPSGNLSGPASQGAVRAVEQKTQYQAGGNDYSKEKNLAAIVAQPPVKEEQWSVKELETELKKAKVGTEQYRILTEEYKRVTGKDWS